MGKPLAVGDRVAVYGSIATEKGQRTFLRGNRCTIIDSPFQPREYNVKTDEWGNEGTIHPKQCRRLVKKPKRVAREFWIIPAAISSASLSHPVVLSFRPDNAGSYVHVIEQLPKKEKMKLLKPNVGDCVQVTSCDWFYWTGEYWKPMTLEEQLEYSK